MVPLRKITSFKSSRSIYTGTISFFFDSSSKTDKCSFVVHFIQTSLDYVCIGGWGKKDFQAHISYRKFKGNRFQMQLFQTNSPHLFWGQGLNSLTLAVSSNPPNLSLLYPCRRFPHTMHIFKEVIKDIILKSVTGPFTVYSPSPLAKLEFGVFCPSSSTKQDTKQKEIPAGSKGLLNDDPGNLKMSNLPKSEA